VTRRQSAAALPELPVQQVTKIEVIINLATAKALGFAFPVTLLGPRQRGD
jgi:hypothetical protein